MGNQILYMSIPLIHHEWLETYEIIEVVIYSPLLIVLELLYRYIMQYIRQPYYE